MPQLGRHGQRRSSFAENAIVQGRRPSILERAIDAIQLHAQGNNDLAVSFSKVNFLAVCGGFTGLLLFFPVLRVVICVFLSALVYETINFLRAWSPKWTWKVALRQYLKVRIMQAVGCYQSWQFHRDSFNVSVSQERTLLRLLSLNTNTDYAKEHNLSAVRNAEDFVRTQPLTKFDNYRPYVERMKQGEAKVLTSEFPYYFGKTSGTTGLPSAVPMTPYMKNQSLAAIACFMYNAQKTVRFQDFHNLRPIWKMAYTNPNVLEQTPSGVVMGPMSANPLWTKGTGEIFTAPSIVFQIEDTSTSGYLQLLFALRYRDLGAMECVFASLPYFAFKKMEAEWRTLVEDIRNGTIKEGLNMENNVKEILLGYLKADPVRADELEEQFERGFDNIAARIWPELTIINCITTGPFEIYARYLRDKYTRDLLLYSTSLTATEGVIAVNFWPHIQPPRYALLPRMHFYEFIPTDASDLEVPQTVLMHQVEIDHDYELVLTSANGFCRYRLGDVVRIISFYNQIPVIAFRHRAGANLNIKGEKVTESSVFQCLQEAAAGLAPRLQRVIDYTSCENVMLDIVGFNQDKKGSYHVIFVDLSTQDPDEDQVALAVELSSAYDEVLKKSHYKYLELRTTKSLEEAYICPIKSGGFNRLRDYMLKTTTTSPIQLKIPRVLHKKELVTFMINERVTQAPS